jgi:hypothetical protein
MEKKTVQAVAVPAGLTEQFELLKESMKKYRVTGTVKEWNFLREEAKETFDEKVIGMLDASGFITEWMKG